MQTATAHTVSFGVDKMNSACAPWLVRARALLLGWLPAELREHRADFLVSVTE